MSLLATLTLALASCIAGPKGSSKPAAVAPEQPESEKPKIDPRNCANLCKLGTPWCTRMGQDGSYDSSLLRLHDFASKLKFSEPTTIQIPASRRSFNIVLEFVENFPARFDAPEKLELSRVDSTGLEIAFSKSTSLPTLTFADKGWQDERGGAITGIQWDGKTTYFRVPMGCLGIDLKNADFSPRNPDTAK